MALSVLTSRTEVGNVEISLMTAYASEDTTVTIGRYASKWGKGSGELHPVPTPDKLGVLLCVRHEYEDSASNTASTEARLLVSTSSSDLR